MIKVIVDTNIVFSAILNSSGRIGKVLLNSRGVFHFVSCKYMLVEINNHLVKLQILSGLEPADLNEIITSITGRINLINEEFVSKAAMLKAETIVKNVDYNDLLFVALALELQAKLWTGDKKLIHGAANNGFNQTITTHELSNILDDLGRKT